MITDAGRAHIAAAQAEARDVVIAQMGIDGAFGVTPTPDGTETALAQEFMRLDVEFTRVNETPGSYTARATIPAEVGPWRARAVGLFAGDGTLLYYTPREIIKAVGDTVVIDSIIMVGPATTVETSYDESTVFATQEDIADRPRLVALTQAEFDALTPDNSTFYTTSDTGRIYLGTLQLTITP